MPGHLAAYDDAAGALHVTGEVGDRHAALARLLVAAGGDDLGVAQHEGAVVVAGLGVLGHVDAEHLGAHPDLRRGETDAARRDTHGGDEVGGEAYDVGRGRVDRRRGGRQDGGRGADDLAQLPGHAEVGLGPLQDPGVEAHRARSELVGLGGAQRDPDAEVGGDAGQLALDGGHVGPGRQVDLGDEQVEVAGQAGGEVGDVAADTRDHRR